MKSHLGNVSSIPLANVLMYSVDWCRTIIIPEHTTGWY